MTAIEAARARVRRLLEALAEGDFELACLVLEELDDDLLRAERDQGSRSGRLGNHCCPICESDCNSTTELKRRVRLLEREVLRRGVAAREAREIKDFAEREIERKFPGVEA